MAGIQYASMVFLTVNFVISLKMSEWIISITGIYLVFSKPCVACEVSRQFAQGGQLGHLHAIDDGIGVYSSCEILMESS